jgi:hypothetical protein
MKKNNFPFIFIAIILVLSIGCSKKEQQALPSISDNKAKSFTTVSPALLDISEVIGKVTDINNTPLAGVFVRRKSSAYGTLTDLNGNYALSAPRGIADTLVCSYLGYHTTEKPYTTPSEIVVLPNIIMLTDIESRKDN